MLSRNPAPVLAFVTRYNTTIVDGMVSWFPTHTGGRHHGPETHTYARTRGPGKGCALRRHSRARQHARCMGARAWHGGRNPMISEAAGAGVIRQDVQQAIESEVRYRLGEGDAPGALSRWQKELLLLVIHTVKANACLSQLHARAAVKAGATLAQVLQVVQYVELTGMVKWVMVGHDALTAAEADVPETQRLTLARDAWAGHEQRLQDIQHYLRRDGH